MEFILDSYKLRRPVINDAEGFIEICSEKETMKYYGTEGSQIRTISEAIEQINWCNSLFENNSGRWIITEIGKDEYIGDIGFHNFQQNHNKAEIGFRIKQSHQRKGIITKCINELVRYGFQTLKYNRIEAQVDSKNEGSKKVLLKNNFTCEGLLREYEYENDYYIDINIYSILRKEFIL
ncbi:MAG: GNAT family N-acetyltransferase [Spirochaetes bacterium]|nr:GNAT family N-acetyltransferase [Spirochaetota bacterium]MBP9023617.1 GNAT family N-acetyltransferase [Spirochaetota bacterium]